MYKVYVLYSRGFDKLYIGFTSSLRARIESHNLLGTHDWTRSYRPWLLIYIEEFETQQEAIKREKALKGGKGREYLRHEILSIYQ